jgi:hypothetical protein
MEKPTLLHELGTIGKLRRVVQVDGPSQIGQLFNTGHWSHSHFQGLLLFISLFDIRIKFINNLNLD